MQGHAEKCVEKYLELSNLTIADLKPVGTPSIDDHLIAANESEEKGKLAPVCSRIVLKVLFFARISRPDLLQSVNTLARAVTKWTAACDRRLLRLISYIHSTKHWVIRCFVGDHIKDLKIYLHCSNHSSTLNVVITKVPLCMMLLV